MRIGINIPNELMKRIDPFRSEINLSQVCRDAIEKLADTHERVKERAAADGLEARIIRLVEPPIMEPDWVGYALDDARDWVASVDPDDWNYFFYLYDFFKSKGRDASELADRPNLRGC